MLPNTLTGCATVAMATNSKIGEHGFVLIALTYHVFKFGGDWSLRFWVTFVPVFIQSEA